jgi:hypothetical protein
VSIGMERKREKNEGGRMRKNKKRGKIRPHYS